MIVSSIKERKRPVKGIFQRADLGKTVRDPLIHRAHYSTTEWSISAQVARTFR